MTAATLKAARKAAAVERTERALASIRPVAISPDLPDAPLVIAPPGSDLPGRGGACLTRLVTLARLGAIPSLYRVVAGSLLAWDATYGEWDTCWRMGHVWLWDAVAGRIVDPSMPDWPKALPRLRWQLHAPLERLTAGLAGLEVCRVARRLPPAQANGCSLLYLPGLTPLDVIEAREGTDPRAVNRLRARHAGFEGWFWRQLMQRLTPAEGTAAALLELYALQQQEVA